MGGGMVEDIPFVSWLPLLMCTRSGHIHFNANAVSATSTIDQLGQIGPESAYQTMILGLLDLYRQYTFDKSCIRQTYLLYCQLLPCREGESLPLNTSICFSEGRPIISKRLTTSKNCYSSAPLSFSSCAVPAGASYCLD